MRNFTCANLISIDTGFGFDRKTDAGMGDVLRNALHLRLYAERSHRRASIAGAGKPVAVVRPRVSVCGTPSTATGIGQTAQPPQGRQPGWCLANRLAGDCVGFVPLVGPAAASSRIS